jgi:hypothetical protein
VERAGLPRRWRRASRFRINRHKADFSTADGDVWRVQLSTHELRDARASIPPHDDLAFAWEEAGAVAAQWRSASPLEKRAAELLNVPSAPHPDCSGAPNPDLYWAAVIIQAAARARAARWYRAMVRLRRLVHKKLRFTLRLHYLHARRLRLPAALREMESRPFAVGSEMLPSAGPLNDRHEVSEVGVTPFAVPAEMAQRMRRTNAIRIARDPAVG